MGAFIYAASVKLLVISKEISDKEFLIYQKEINDNGFGNDPFLYIWQYKYLRRILIKRGSKRLLRHLDLAFLISVMGIFIFLISFFIMILT